MKFGLNNDINREPIKEKHIEKEKHLDSLGNEKPKKVHQEIKTEHKEKPEIEKLKIIDHKADFIPIFAVSSVMTYLITKYVL